MRWLLVIALVSCEGSKTRELDHDLIRVSPEAELRTDAVGEGKWEEQATFVLVDAENTAEQGAYVTLAGELGDAAGAKVTDLKPQSLWVPAHGSRTFALVDHERKPRPTAAGAKIFVRGAIVPASPPAATVDSLREIPDNGKLVVQGLLHNTAKRAGNIMVIASFHDAAGKPMTRPFAMVHVDGGETQAVQFVSGLGAQHGTIYVGDVVY